jgi:hypothetical protein
MSISSLTGSWHFGAGFTTSPPPPPASPPPPGSPPPPPTSESTVVVTRRRIMAPSSLSLPLGYGPLLGGRPPGSGNVPPLDIDGTTDETLVVVTGQRDGRFRTVEEAVRFSTSLIAAHPERRNREIGMFILKLGDGYEVGEPIVGKRGDIQLGGFSENGSDSSHEVPRNAVAFVHSHPPGIKAIRQAIPQNTYLSKGDLEAWTLFKRVTGHDDFRMYLLGPDGYMREYDVPSDVPFGGDPNRLPGRSPDPEQVPIIGDRVNYSGEPAPLPVPPLPLMPWPERPPEPDRPPGPGERWR